MVATRRNKKQGIYQKGDKVEVTRPPSGELGVGTLVSRQKKQRNVVGYQWVIEYDGHDTQPVKGIISERNIQRLLPLKNALTPAIVTPTAEESPPIEEHPATVSDTSIVTSTSLNAHATTKTVKPSTIPLLQHHKTKTTTTTTATTHTNGTGTTATTITATKRKQMVQKGITKRMGRPVRKIVLQTGILYVYQETRRAEFVRTK